MPQYIIVQLDHTERTLADGWLFTRKVFTDHIEAWEFLDAQTVPKARLLVIEAPFPIPASLIADDWKQADGNTDKVCVRPPASATSKPPLRDYAKTPPKQTAGKPRRRTKGAKAKTTPKYTDADWNTAIRNYAD